MVYVHMRISNVRGQNVRKLNNMNIIQKCSEDDFSDEYVLLSRESIQRLVDKSARTNDDKTQKIIIQLSKWMYDNNLIEYDDY